MNQYEPYRASRALERFITDAAPLHYATADAPNSYASLMEHYGDLVAGHPIPVSNAGCADTIYSMPMINHAWRAYHDGIHMVHELGFDLEDEMQTCEVQIEHMKQHAEHYGFTGEDYLAVRADIIGQAMYYDKYKLYVRDQARFVASVLDRGIMLTLEDGGIW